MSMCRRFKGAEVMRLIVSVPTAMVAEIDDLLTQRRRHPADGCRAEFVRLAIAEKLSRDLMICAGHKGPPTINNQDQSMARDRTAQGKFDP